LVIVGMVINLGYLINPTFFYLPFIDDYCTPNIGTNDQ